MENELRWHKLEDEKPVGDGCVVLFPVITDVGLLYDNIYRPSNPEYARITALEKGYTHWFPIPKHPDEDAIKEKIKELYSDEYLLDLQFYKGLNVAYEHMINFIEDLVPDRPGVIQALRSRFKEAYPKIEEDNA